MANITLSIDDALLQAARVRAVKEGTSVNEVCRRAIEQYARRQDDRLARYRALTAKIDAEHAATRRQPLAKMTREELYETMTSHRGPKR